MKKNSVLEKKFQKEKSGIDLKDGFAQIFMEMHRRSEKLLLWNMLCDESLVKIDAKIKTVKERQKKVVLEISEEGRNHAQMLFSGSGNVNLYLYRKSILCESDVVQYDGDRKIIISFPHHHERVCRRKNERLLPMIPVVVNISNANGMFVKRCFDISTGGFSIIVGRQEKGLLQEGMKVVCEMVSIFKKINLKAEVISVALIDPYLDSCHAYKSFKVSCRFLELSLEQENCLLEFISKNTEKINLDKYSSK